MDTNAARATATITAAVRGPRRAHGFSFDSVDGEPALTRTYPRPTDSTSLSSPNRNAEALVTSPLFQALAAALWHAAAVRLVPADCAWKSAIRGRQQRLQDELRDAWSSRQRRDLAAC